MNKRRNRTSALKAAMFIAAVLILTGIIILGGMIAKKYSTVPVSDSDSRVSSGETVSVSLEESSSEASLPESAESVSSETSAAESAEETDSSAQEELKGVIGAAIPNVAAYADAKNHGTGGAGAGKLICIDPGHQDHGMPEMEPNGPGSASMKAKLTSGTDGSASGKHEYEVNLEVSLQLRDELIRRGYSVLMTRTANDVEISNVERAVLANEAKADAFIRIHCNSSDSSSVRGVLCYQPSVSNPYLTPEVIAESRRLAAALLEAQIASTGQENRGLLEGDDMTGINWAQMPVTIVEMGFMSNPEEDLYMAGSEGQAAIVQGLANGVDAFFAGSAAAAESSAEE